MAPVKEMSKGSRQGSRARPKAVSAQSGATSLVERLRKETLETERKEPLQGRILRALRASEATPSDLNRQLSATKEAISRLLGKLLQSGLVEYRLIEGDGRRRLYRLTPAGDRALGRHRVYGGKPEALPPAPETSELVRAGLENAVRMRRQANRLDEAAERMQIVLDQARVLEDNELLIDTLAELAATLRQARRYEELDEVMQELEQITLGEHPSNDVTLVIPAAAHRQYELGRVRDGGVADPHERARHLDTAQSLYCQLRRYAELRRKPTWGQREGWSVLSLAGNLRERSHFEQAIERASTAMTLFRDIDDEYGETRSLFVIGLCLRLMGDFRGAWSHLAQALKLAQEHTFERFQTDTLLQMGDVQRCMGQIGSARLLLAEALIQGDRMNLELIQAFALSSLGACAYQQGDYDEAKSHLSRAQTLFKHSHHKEGLALNARRQAAVRCRLTGELTARLEQQLNATRKRYEELRSPAGAAACDIDLGRARLLAGADPSKEIARLMERLEDPPQRDLIELDPWVPTYLLEFSKEPGARALRGSAKGVVTDGLRRRCDWFSQRAAGTTDGANVANVDKRILEMGSEPRRASYRVSSEIDLKRSASPTAGQRLAADLGRERKHMALFVPAVGSIHAIADLRSNVALPRST